LLDKPNRTEFLCYVLGGILKAITGNQSSPKCGDFGGLVLPCPRILWDYHSRDSWAHRLDQFKTEGFSERSLTVDDLKSVIISDSVVDEMLVDAMARWCREIDEFGNLVWIGISLMYM
jgi:hypothetical protein